VTRLRCPGCGHTQDMAFDLKGSWRVRCHACDTEFTIYVISSSPVEYTFVACPECGDTESIPRLGEQLQLTCNSCGRSWVQSL